MDNKKEKEKEDDGYHDDDNNDHDDDDHDDDVNQSVFASVGSEAIIESSKRRVLAGNYRGGGGRMQ